MDRYRVGLMLNCSPGVLKLSGRRAVFILYKNHAGLMLSGSHAMFILY